MRAFSHWMCILMRICPTSCSGFDDPRSCQVETWWCVKALQPNRFQRSQFDPIFLFYKKKNTWPYSSRETRTRLHYMWLRVRLNLHIYVLTEIESRHHTRGWKKKKKKSLLTLMNGTTWWINANGNLPNCPQSRVQFSRVFRLLLPSQLPIEITGGKTFPFSWSKEWGLDVCVRSHFPANLFSRDPQTRYISW